MRLRTWLPLLTYLLTDTWRSWDVVRANLIVLQSAGVLRKYTSQLLMHQCTLVLLPATALLAFNGCCIAFPPVSICRRGGRISGDFRPVFALKERSKLLKTCWGAL